MLRNMILAFFLALLGLTSTCVHSLVLQDLHDAAEHSNSSFDAQNATLNHRWEIENVSEHHHQNETPEMHWNLSLHHNLSDVAAIGVQSAIVPIGLSSNTSEVDLKMRREADARDALHANHNHTKHAGAHIIVPALHNESASLGHKENNSSSQHQKVANEKGVPRTSHVWPGNQALNMKVPNVSDVDMNSTWHQNSSNWNATHDDLIVKEHKGNVPNNSENNFHPGQLKELSANHSVSLPTHSNLALNNSWVALDLPKPIKHVTGGKKVAWHEIMKVADEKDRHLTNSSAAAVAIKTARAESSSSVHEMHLGAVPAEAVDQTTILSHAVVLANGTKDV